ncbi:MAG: hypothetical protein Tsb009_11010 [Planctomycetaceae bacterium]
MEMMPEEDRKKIPASYWRQFDNSKFHAGSNPTPFSCINHRFHVVFFIQKANGYDARDSGIRFRVNGDEIQVVEVNSAFLESLSK